MGNGAIRVMFVDDHELMLMALRTAVKDAHDVQVVAEAHSGEEALEMVEAVGPHVALMDLNMPGMGGIECTRRFKERYPHVGVLVVSAHVTEPYPTQALNAGALGFLSKNSFATEVVRAIHKVRQGQRYIAAEIAGSIATRLLEQESRSPFDQLSERELAVTLKVTTGSSVTEIADLLHISPNTVSTYKQRVLSKLNVRNDVELTLMAVRHGLIGDRLDS